MKKLFLLLGVFTLLFASCEPKVPDYGWLEVHNSRRIGSGYIFIDVIDSNGKVCLEAIVDSYEYYAIPVGNYTVKAYDIAYEKEKRVTIHKGVSSSVYFY